ncbi:hypothetical protein OSH11_07050 [Kaistia dalseonensis]|uniref:V/A-type H+-transporting ATPase subunit E n=1 Tax=Kaistia dalseonensis TaxID=410840 RepID=A0ABU0H3Z8_9HYPH|nr:hypothetical protein [Kaistia dalseonensis]MCX5494451.1 hypothetical protein [Kaistia dalseonensis]MDQ0437030.1 V/A-type H+-transporting ATPase subunit E [Kaistia dalseonensis]
MAAQIQAQKTESGVETLIARLRDQGVAAGRSEAERLKAEAEAAARAIIDGAEKEAQAKIEAARKEAEAFRRAGEDALKQAARDIALELKERLARRFADDVGKAVSDAMRDEDMLKRMILALVGRVRTESGADQSADIELLLPRAVIGLDDLRRKPEELREGPLTRLVAAFTGEMLREGVRYGRAEDGTGGITIVLADRGVSIDVTDKAVADALLAHMQPRFRAILEGVVS